MKKTKEQEVVLVLIMHCLCFTIVIDRVWLVRSGAFKVYLLCIEISQSEVTDQDSTFRMPETWVRK